ncbi:YncE family protein [Paraliomyxa miuraensis]|uniref:YncE family protein n=1 Tax=Paraliomyxa miuraensis TaxID=376150 RepID=UPI002251829C|nr:YncE family protein [Paraliomyxa miuraensis]MCX4240792.1 YncE family protein [Paraliomyxa miuraensis]
MRHVRPAIGLLSSTLACTPKPVSERTTPAEPLDAVPVAIAEAEPTVEPTAAEPSPEPEPPLVHEPPPVEPPPEPPPPERPLIASPGGPALEITRRVRTGVQPKSVTISPDGSRLYVCNFGHAGRRNVYVYDAASLERVGHIDFRGNAAEATVSADGSTVYVSNFARGVIEVVDASSLKVRHEVKVGNNPKFMVVDEARELLYVSNWSARTVSAVDLPARRVDHTLRTGRRPRGMALMSDGTLLVGAMWDHRVQVYAPGQVRPALEFEACENPRHLVLSPDQARLYVSCSGDDALRWFDPRTGEVLGEAPTGDNPRTIDISGDGRWVAIADFSGSTVTLVDLRNMLHRTHEMPRTHQIVGLGVVPGDELRVLATSWLTNELLELRPEGADHAT